jgi:hypothetical protein
VSGFRRRRRGARPTIRKDATEELSRLDKLLSTMEARVRAAFSEFVRQMRSEEVLKEVADKLEARDIDGALAIADSHVARLGSVIPVVFQDAAVAEAADFAAKVGPLRPTVGISFDATDPAAAALMRANTLNFVREFSAAQREATRTALVDALGSGQSRQAAARAFRESIGLTSNQRDAVESYRALLEGGSRDALARALRDRRFDPSVEAAADGRRELTPDQIDRMVDRYRARYLAYRAETIARTESVRVISQAREEAFRQTIDRAGIAQEDTEQVWHAVEDNRTRITHRALDGQVQPFGEPFVSISGAELRYPGDPLAPIEETVNCRCHRTFRIKAEALAAAA